MIYFSLQLSNYDVDEFTLPVSAGNMSIMLKFRWPTDMQLQYDNQFRHLTDMVNRMSFLQVHDFDYYFQIPYSDALIRQWALFITYFDNDNPDDRYYLIESVKNAPWPQPLKAEVEELWAALESEEVILPSSLRNSIEYLLNKLEPEIAYLHYLQEFLVWRIEASNVGLTRTACLNANTWLFQGYSDFKLFAKTPHDHVGRDQLNSVRLYAAVGDGDIV